MRSRTRLARLVLALYPRGFRERYRQQVLEAFRLQCEEDGHAARAIADLLIALPGAHLRSLGSTACSASSLARALPSDVRMAMRRLVREPGPSLTVFTTIALGVSAATILYSFAYGVLLRPLPFDQPQELVRVQGITGEGAAEPVSLLDALDLRSAPTLEGVAMHDLVGTRLLTPGGVESVGSAQVSADFFSLLGVEPAEGRLFVDGEDRSPATTAVISHPFWVSRFGARPDVVGQSLDTDDGPLTIVGVLPASFEDPMTDPDYPVRIYTLFHLEPSELVRDQHSFQALARLRAGLDITVASEDARRIAADIEARFPEGKEGRSLRLVPLRDAMLGDAGPALSVLIVALAFFLGIVCVNIGGLLLARSGTRRGEVAVRVSLGAGRWLVVRQLMVESLLVAALGGAAALGLTYLAHGLLLPLAEGQVPRLEGVQINAPVMLFALLSAALVALVAGLVPALSVTDLDAGDELRRVELRPTGARRARRSLEGLVVMEIALTVVLLTGAGLVLKSFGRLMSVEKGFEVERTLTFRVSHSLGGDRTGELYNLHDRLRSRLEQLPGVEAAGAVNFLPLRGNWACIPYTGEGVPRDGDPCAEFRTVTPGYFDAMSMEVVAGRPLEDGDAGGAPLVAVVNETLAETLWPNGDPLGRRFGWGRSPSEAGWWTVVGVVRDVRHFGVAEPAAPEAYMTYRQGGDISTMFAVRMASEDDRERVLPVVRATLQELGSDVSVSSVAMMSEYLDRDVAGPRARATVLGTFAGLGLVLALLGVYGLVAYSVVQRTAELGIRYALGAATGSVVRSLLARGLLLGLIGVALGMGIASVTSPALASFLFEVEPLDPAVLVGAALLMVGTALAATWIPARRASRIDPVIALRGG